VVTHISLLENWFRGVEGEGAHGAVTAAALPFLPAISTDN
jgi:hypothetical protein